MLIDTHAHLTWPDFKSDFKEVLQRTFDAGVKTVINIGADLESSREAAILDCSPLANYSSIGIHPEEGLRGLEGVRKLENIYRTHPDKVIAVGECGLDYLSPKEGQKELFLAQINLAKKLQLPLIIHCRQAWDDIFLPELNGHPTVFHYFTGSRKEAEKIIDLGFYLSFSCVITYPKNEALREVIKITPLDKMFAETDSPFSPPQGKRGERNEPANVVEVIKTIAQVKNLPEKEVSEAVWQNAKKFFRLPAQ